MRTCIFVDESGNPSRRDCYILAGVWCLTEYDDLSEILKPTRDRIANRVVDTDGELKGEMLETTKLDSVLVFLRKVLGEDDSIVPNNVWGTGSSVSFTLSDVDTDTGRGIVEWHLGESTNTAVTVQLIALASVTSPLLRLSRYASVDITEFHVALDSTTWKRAGNVLQGIYSSMEWVPDVSFSYRDSRSTPGIQIADLAAHARRERLIAGDCIKGSSVVDEMRL